MRSRVMPGSSPTMARRCPMIALNRVDLPTLGLPTITTTGRLLSRDMGLHGNNEDYEEMKACPTCRNTYSDGVGFCPNDGASLSLVNQLQPGLVIRQRFRIDARLGRGGFGEVYR